MLLVAGFGQGCATIMLTELGKTGPREAVKEYKSGYLWKDKLILTYRATDLTTLGKQGESSERYASLPVDLGRKAVLSYKFEVERSGLPERMREQARPVSLTVNGELKGVGAADAPVTVTVGKFYGSLETTIQVVFRDGGEQPQSFGLAEPGSEPRKPLWTVPIMIVGLPATLAFDVVTFPVQAVYGMYALFKPALPQAAERSSAPRATSAPTPDPVTPIPKPKY